MEDYKQKYKDALERAKEELGSGCFNKGSIEYIFPELKVSEDERIREELIDAIHGLWDNDALPMPLSVKRKDEWISWLEKQVSPQMVADAYLRGCNDTEKKWLESKRYTKMDVDNAYLEGIANAKREFEKSKPTVIDIDKMVSKYANTKESTTSGLPVNCQIRAYRKGINDALNLLLDIEKPITIGKRQLTGKAKELYDNLDTESLAETKKKMLAEKSKWTEEDEEMFEEYRLGIQDLMKDAYFEKFCNWIFSLKQRLLQ